ncbi:MAG: CGGC domain-containing protein [Eubacteriales bacterium]|nr:CGGC domain-containing protein [Eubacteriales bacterium]
MKIAILNCLQANTVCTGAACLKAFNSKTRHFARYEKEPLELVALARCNGCEAGIDGGFREKLDRIVSEGAQACHLGVCTVRRGTGQECPVIRDAAAYLESKGVSIIRGTH